MTNRLSELRRARGLPLRALTVATGGISASTLSAIERWGYVPAQATRARIADALGVNVEDIWPGIVDTRQP